VHEAHPGARVVVHLWAARDIGPIQEQSDDQRPLLPSSEELKQAGLTSAELEVLPLLANHMSFAEISERLGLERSVVDSRALSIYRKLGVSPLSNALDLFDS
jgi:DNA-binding NarL/FixJ family response regulator